MTILEQNYLERVPKALDSISRFLSEINRKLDILISEKDGLDRPQTNRG